MDVLLIRPPQKTNEVQPPLGLGYIASNVKDICNVRILDCIKDKINIKKFNEFIKKNKYDVIGLQCYSRDLDVVREMANYIRSLYHDIILLIGGPQPSLDPINTMEYLDVIDYGFCGEAEESFRMLIIYLKNKKSRLKKIPGLIYKNSGEYVVNSVKLIDNLDRFDPGWDFFDLKSYPNAPHGAFFKQSPISPLIITRGCPFNCTYCGAPIISGRKLRKHSVDYVIKQIVLLKQKYGVKEIHIEDDNFTMNKEFVLDFCNRLIEKNIDISWTLPNGVRIDTLDRDLIRLMKKSGLYSLSVGIESGSDRVRKLMRKNLSTKTITEKLEMLKHEGISLIGFFIIGYPGETIEEIERTIRFSIELPLDRAAFSIFKPFPGTEIYNELKDNGELKELEWKNFSLDKVVWSSADIGDKRLRNLRKIGLIKFYTRPRILFKMIREVKDFNNFRYIIVRIFRWLI